MSQPSASHRPRTIAVVIPVYNAGSFICEALDSVAAQTRRPDECLVIDDGSTDDTGARVAAWNSEHPLNVRLLRQEKVGAAGARSAGVRAAGSDLVALLDADDLWGPGALRTLEAGFDLWPDLAVCFGDARRQLLDGTAGTDYLAGKPVWSLPFEVSFDPRDGDEKLEVRRIEAGVFESLLGGSYIANCAALVKRRTALEAGLWRDEFPTAEDRDFWLRLSRLGPFAYVPEIVATVRYHESNLTAIRGGGNHATDAARVLLSLAQRHEELGLSPHETGAVAAAARHAVEQALYVASREGPWAYVRIVRVLRNRTTRVPWWNPRHLARLVLSPFMRATRRAP